MMYGRGISVGLLAALSTLGCTSTTTIELPQRTELQFSLRVAQGIEFDREWVTVTFDDGSAPRTVSGAEFEGGLVGEARTDWFVLPPQGEVAVHIEIARDGVVIGVADRTLPLAENRRYIIRVVLDAEDPVPCFGCTHWVEIPFAGGSLPVDTFWVITISGLIEGGGIT